MAIDIQLDGPLEKWETVTFSAGDFEVLVHHPSYAELALDQEAQITRALDPASKTQTEIRLETVIVDWRGVSGGPKSNAPGLKMIEFNWDNVAAVCQKYPDLFRALCRIAHRVYSGITEDESGNSGRPASGPSAAGQSKTT